MQFEIVLSAALNLHHNRTIVVSLNISCNVYFLLERFTSGLGFLYQNKDLEYHNGGILQPAALNAFNKALELGSERPEVVIRVNQQKGVSPSYDLHYVSCSPFCSV